MSVSVEQVDEIVALDDPVLRNLKITLAYGRMGHDFAEHVDDRNLSWCTFGTWASEGVGSAIRHHETEKSIPLRILRAVRRTAYPGIARAAAAAFAEGNQRVFDDIGRAFAGYFEALAAEADDPTSVERFLDALPPFPTDAGIDLALTPPPGLREGFAAYEAARRTDDPRRRAELVCFANLCLAHVEQVRLQGPIVAAFGAVVPKRWLKEDRLTRLADRLVTETILKIRIDRRRYRPGWRVPKRAGRRFPEDLTELDASLFAVFDEAGVTTGGRSDMPHANHWRSLRDRLTYIGALMRSLQQVRSLIGPLPLAPCQIAAIDRGEAPPCLRPPPDLA
jgi:hypothetical protein